MTASERYDALTRQLVDAVRSTEPLAGLALLGSASEAGAARRDDWSDHDFFAIAAPGRGPDARASVGWLPDVDRVVLVAREGAIGFVAVYDDAHVFEFAVAEPAELVGVLAGDASVVVDDEDGRTAALIDVGRRGAADADGFDAENDTRLVLVKILLGVGRIRRGEVLNGGQFIRTWAVSHLVRAIRGRFPGEDPGVRDRIDPTRRFESEHPVWGRAITDALDAPVEEAARRLFALTRDILEPGWTAFPTAAADTVARRLGW